MYVNLNVLINEVDDKDFVVLGFPCNQFGQQEPGTNAEIPNGVKYVRPGGGYVPNFNLMAKTKVNGAYEDKLFTFLKSSCPNPLQEIGYKDRLFWSPFKQSDITWNFEKFLIGRDGIPVRRYSPTFDVLDFKDHVIGELTRS